MSLFNKEQLIAHLKGSVALSNGNVKLENADKFRDHALDDVVANAVLNENKEVKALCRYIIKSVALDMGIVPSSIQGLYEAMGRGEYHGFTVPAINIRGMSYQLSRSIFRSAHKIDCGAIIFEIAKSEMGYTNQNTHELAAVILAAAIKENYQGPVFLQGDHFQANAKSYSSDKEKEVIFFR